MASQRQSAPKRSPLATKLRILNQIAFDRRDTRLFSQLFYRSTGSEPEEYAKWYFNNLVWQDTTWMGIETYKSPCDMWNYQEILVDLFLIDGFSFELGSCRLGFDRFIKNGRHQKLLPLAKQVVVRVVLIRLHFVKERLRAPLLSRSKSISNFVKGSHDAVEHLSKPRHRRNT